MFDITNDEKFTAPGARQRIADAIKFPRHRAHVIEVSWPGSLQRKLLARFLLLRNKRHLTVNEMYRVTRRSACRRNGVGRLTLRATLGAASVEHRGER